MPITDELRSMERLEKAGLPRDHAKAVVEVVEDGVQRGFERFAEVLDRRLAEFEQRMVTEFERVRTEMQTIRGDLLKEQRDQMLRFAAIVSFVVALIGAAYRFF